MRRFFILGLVLLMSLSTFSAWSQLQLPGDMTAEQASIIIKAAQKRAKAENILVNIAIVDAGANLKAFLRMDGSYLGSIDVAIKKAKTARYFNAPTGEIGKIAQPGEAIYNIEHSNDGLITFPGGMPIKDKKGIIIGAIGISGGTIEQDHDIATGAAESIL
ncbi:GlcG/HbpS family heme-binding protein [Agaribacillus aureus]